MKAGETNIGERRFYVCRQLFTWEQLSNMKSLACGLKRLDFRNFVPPDLSRSVIVFAFGEKKSTVFSLHMRLEISVLD